MCLFLLCLTARQTIPALPLGQLSHILASEALSD